MFVQVSKTNGRLLMKKVLCSRNQFIDVSRRERVVSDESSMGFSLLSENLLKEVWFVPRDDDKFAHLRFEATQLFSFKGIFTEVVVQTLSSHLFFHMDSSRSGVMAG